MFREPFDTLRQPGLLVPRLTEGAMPTICSATSVTFRRGVSVLRKNNFDRNKYIRRLAASSCR